MLTLMVTVDISNVAVYEVFTCSVSVFHVAMQARERPRSAVIIPDDNLLIAPNRKMPLYRSLSKSMSIANIAG